MPSFALNQDKPMLSMLVNAKEDFFQKKKREDIERLEAELT